MYYEMYSIKSNLLLIKYKNVIRSQLIKLAFLVNEIISQFEALYRVWLLEPEYAKEYLFKIYGSLENFISKLNPDDVDLQKAKQIIKQC